jgi:hypothetical protein
MIDGQMHTTIPVILVHENDVAFYETFQPRKGPVNCFIYWPCKTAASDFPVPLFRIGTQWRETDHCHADR